MGSSPTLDPAPTRPPTPTQPSPYALGSQHQLLDHLRAPAAGGGHEFADWPLPEIAAAYDGDLVARHTHDHTRLADQFPHTHPDRTRNQPLPHPEQTFDRLNPDFGVPADSENSYARQAIRDREAALSLDTRVAIASSRENDRNPIMWLAGQDYRAADAARTARLQPIRQRHGPKRVRGER
jgi:hypothetical protein